MRFAVVTLPLFLAVACGEPEPELPEGWEEAEPVVEFSQSPCGGDPVAEPQDQSINVTTGGGTADVVWENARFRCDQAVEGFLRRTAGALDLLVQPTDLNPDEVARCDCYYTLNAGFNTADSDRTFTFYTRADEVGGPSSPSRVGSVTVE